MTKLKACSSFFTIKSFYFFTIYKNHLVFDVPEKVKCAFNYVIYCFRYLGFNYRLLARPLTFYEKSLRLLKWRGGSISIVLVCACVFMSGNRLTNKYFGQLHMVYSVGVSRQVLLV